MKIQFCGAAQTVTGSNHLISLKNGKQYILDCGLYQGNTETMLDFNQKWYYQPKDIDALILSHAHIDHSGRIPKLVKDGFKGKIYCTSATRDLCSIMLLDSAHIQMADAKHAQKRGIKNAKPLYTDIDVKSALKLFRTVEYDKWFWVDNDIKAIFKDAGHILGSASITLEINEDDKLTRIGFTGDIGRWNRPILRDPELMPECDYIITESTYGGEKHLESPQEIDKILQIIHQTCVEKKGKLIIPAFSIGRTQELLYKFDMLYLQGKLPAIPVYLDSPLAINATEIFRMHPECMDEDIEEHLLKDDNPFGWNGLTYIKNQEESKLLNQSEEPCIIISASGMAEAGRVKHHIYHQIDNEKNTVLIVGYCAEGTLGAKLVKKPDIVKIFGVEKKVNASIEILGSMSAHADDEEMRQFLHNQKNANEVYLVHGEIKRQERLKTNLMLDGFKKVAIPTLGDIININE